MTDPLRVIAAAFAAALGLVFGSFANVCIARLPRHQSVVRPGSRCPHCLIPIRYRDNIPLWSWIALKGRCRACGNPISVRYPLVELAVAVLWTAAILRFGAGLHGVGVCILCWFAVTLCGTDAETLLLPNSLTLPLIGLGLAFRMAEGAARSGASGARGAGLRSAGAALGAAFVLLAVRSAYWAWRRRTGLGLGDVKLYAGIAAWLGVRSAVLTLFLSVVSAAAYGIGNLSLSRRARDPALRVPLGAFLCLATLFTVFFGRAVLQWYLGLFPT